MKFPPMDCCRCGGCCGPVPISVETRDRIAAFVEDHGIEPRTRARGDLVCPFWAPREGCLIYPVRPPVCRAFGHIPRLMCAHGLDVLVPEGQRPFVERALHRDIEGFCGLIEDYWGTETTPGTGPP